MREEIESAISAYDENVKKRSKKIQESMEEQADEDGWVTVTAGNKGVKSFKARPIHKKGKIIKKKNKAKK